MLSLLQSWWGDFAVQAVLHGFVALFLFEAALQAWRIGDPRARFLFHATVLILPLFTYPIFQLLQPARGNFYFRLDDALFDSRMWLTWEPWGAAALPRFGFTSLMAASVAVVALQELNALARHRRLRAGATGGAGYPRSPELEETVQGLLPPNAGPSPAVYLLSEPRALLFCSPRPRRIYVSTGAQQQLPPAELRSALAHELGHLLRQSQLTTVLLYGIRLLLFFSPVALVVFRWLAQDDEHVCDAMAVRLAGGDSHALANALQTLQAMSPPAAHAPQHDAANHETQNPDLKPRERLAELGHGMLVAERIERLRSTGPVEAQDAVGPYMLTLFITIALTYWIV